MPTRASIKKPAPKRKVADRDFTSVARRVVEQAIGERLDGSPLPEEPPDTRNPAAVTLSKLGASKGGKARAESLTKAKRKQIAQKAARARWRR
jgi:hypothetical protein